MPGSRASRSRGAARARSRRARRPRASPGSPAPRRTSGSRGPGGDSADRARSRRGRPARARWSARAPDPRGEGSRAGEGPSSSRGARPGLDLYSSLLTSLLDPAVRIALVLERHGMGREPERTERVHHHGELLGALLPDRALVGPGVGTVGDAVRVDREARLLDSLPRHEVAPDVIDDLVRVHVRVVVGSRDGERVVIEQPRDEGADHEPRPVERLVDGRRLMDAPGDRLEVLDVEGVGPQVSVPTDYIHGVMAVDVSGDGAAGLDADLELSLLVARLELPGRPQVPLAVRGVLEELTVVVQVPARRLDVPVRLDHEHALLRPPPGKDARQGPRRKDQVIPGAVRERAELGLEDALPLVDEDGLVAVREPVPVLHGLPGPRHRDYDVRIRHEGDPAPHRVPVRLQRAGAHEAMSQRPRLLEGDLDAALHLELLDARRRVQVVEERLVPGEAADPEELLVMKRAVGLPELRVSLVRDLSQPVIVRHVSSRKGALRLGSRAGPAPSRSPR